MSAIASRLARPTLYPALRRYWLELAWGVWSALNLGAIVIVPSGETIPFHFIWVSLSLVYSYRMWKLRHTALVLLMVVATTGVALAWAVGQSEAGFDEWAEVPLMALMFVAMMWHVERRQDVLEEVRRLATSERRLLEGQREMIRDVSHELRTPITIARGHAELLKAAYAGQLAAEDADVILHELNRLSRLAERLLILAAAEHADFLHKGPVDVGRFLTEAGRRWKGAARRHWVIQPNTDKTILADEERLGYGLDALIENAIKFTEDGDAITLTATDDGSEAVLTVADAGVGIPAEHLDRIFRRFARVDHERTRRNGTGLGLAIVKAIVDAHGGSVQVTSEVGRGTVFEVRLPLR